MRRLVRSFWLYWHTSSMLLVERMLFFDVSLGERMSRVGKNWKLEPI